MQKIRLICAWLLVVVLLALAGLHVYWALGGTWAKSATLPTIGGRRTIHPSRFITFVVAGLLVLGAATISGRAGLFATGSWAPLFEFGAWLLFVAFLLRTIGNLRTFGFFKTVHGSTFSFWDTRLYTPLCAVLAVLVAIVASGSE